jgi:hypothetical protein
MDVNKSKGYYGGDFPVVKGAKHVYPESTDTDAWMHLVAESLTYRRLVRYCLRTGRPSPVDCKRSQFEYVLYHSRPAEKSRRSTRNRHRSQLGLKVGDPRHVHHTDRRNLSISKAVVLTPCEHRRAHGLKCHTKDKPVPKGAKRFTHGHVPISKLLKKRAPAVRKKAIRPAKKVSRLKTKLK